jgi:hypothetical protein
MLGKVKGGRRGTVYSAYSREGGNVVRGGSIRGKKYERLALGLTKGNSGPRETTLCIPHLDKNGSVYEWAPSSPASGIWQTHAAVAGNAGIATPSETQSLNGQEHLYTKDRLQVYSSHSDGANEASGSAGTFAIDLQGLPCRPSIKSMCLRPSAGGSTSQSHHSNGKQRLAAMAAHEWPVLVMARGSNRLLRLRFRRPLSPFQAFCAAISACDSSVSGARVQDLQTNVPVPLPVSLPPSPAKQASPRASAQSSGTIPSGTTNATGGAASGEPLPDGKVHIAVQPSLLGGDELEVTLLQSNGIIGLALDAVAVNKSIWSRRWADPTPDDGGD